VKQRMVESIRVWQEIKKIKGGKAKNEKECNPIRIHTWRHYNFSVFDLIIAVKLE